jgi:hypothetical protein
MALFYTVWCSRNLYYTGYTIRVYDAVDDGALPDTVLCCQTVQCTARYYMVQSYRMVHCTLLYCGLMATSAHGMLQAPQSGVTGVLSYIAPFNGNISSCDFTGDTVSYGCHVQLRSVVQRQRQLVGRHRRGGYIRLLAQLRHFVRKRRHLVGRRRCHS